MRTSFGNNHDFSEYVRTFQEQMLLKIGISVGENLPLTNLD